MALAGTCGAHAPACPLLQSRAPAPGRAHACFSGRPSELWVAKRHAPVLTHAAAVEESAPPETVVDQLPSAANDGLNNFDDEADTGFEGSLDLTNADELYARFNALLEAESTAHDIGDKVVGEIISLDGRGVWVDLGLKTPCYCPISELTTARIDKGDEAVQPGMVREFVVTQYESRNYGLSISGRRLEEGVLWERFRQIAAEGATVQATIAEATRAGAIMSCQGIPGFIPGSKLGAISAQAMDAHIGEVLECTFLDVDEERGRLVLANRTRSKETRDFRVGEVVDGKVQSIQPYGAFVELVPGVNGLLHVSQVSHDMVRDLDALLQPGDTIKVLILTHDRERGRISLSTKKLEPTPGAMLRDPAAVFARADEMAASFKEKMAEAEAIARQDKALSEAQPYA